MTNEKLQEIIDELDALITYYPENSREKESLQSASNILTGLPDEIVEKLEEKCTEKI